MVVKLKFTSYIPNYSYLNKYRQVRPNDNLYNSIKICLGALTQGSLILVKAQCNFGNFANTIFYPKWKNIPFWGSTNESTIGR